MSCARFEGFVPPLNSLGSLGCWEKKKKKILLIGILDPWTPCMCPVVALWVWYFHLVPAGTRDRHSSTTSSDSIRPANAGATRIPSLELVLDGAPRYGFGVPSTYGRESFPGQGHP